MTFSANDLARKHCAACEGNIPRLQPQQMPDYLKALPAWELAGDGRRIRRSWRVKDFASGLDFFQRIGQIAESENHHPDLHLTGYRYVTVELSTHAIGGLSENDFILAARIDELPVAFGDKK
jgi:4a-hydroxytetrahydrobiopterin dehydratase